VTSDAALVQHGSDDDTSAEVDKLVAGAGKLKSAMKELAKHFPNEAADLKDKVANIGGDKFDPARMAQDLCKKEKDLSEKDVSEKGQKGLEERCAALKKEASYENMHAVLRRGLKLVESGGEGKGKADTKMLKTSCDNWEKKHAGNAGSVLAAAAPFMSCVCDDKNEGSMSYCAVTNAEAMKHTVEVFEQVGLDAAQAKLLEKAGTGFEGPNIATKESLLAHPMFGELLQTFAATHPTETTASGRKKTLMDNIVEKHGGTSVDLIQNNQVCRDISRMTSFDPVKMAKKFKHSIRGATAGVFSCSGGCDLGGSVSITCDAYGVAAVEVGWDFSRYQLFVKFKMCVPTLSDILDVLSDVPCIKDFLEGQGIDGGCLLLGHGILDPSNGWVELSTNFPRRMLAFTLKFATRSYINYDWDIQTRKKACFAYTFGNRGGLSGATNEIMDFIYCYYKYIAPPVSKWAILARVDISLNVDVVVYTKRLGGFEHEFIW